MLAPRTTALLTALIAIAVPSIARAAGSNSWARVSSSNLASIDEAGLGRATGGNLYFAYRRPAIANPAHNDLVVATLNPAGSVIGSQTVASDWGGIGNPDMSVSPDGTARITFGGQEHVITGEAHDGANLAVRDSADTAFAVTPASFAPGPGSSDDVSSIWAPGVGLLSSWDTTFGTTVHSGLDPAFPTGGDFQAALGGCCGYYSKPAVDGASGATWLVWYSNATTHPGVHARRIDATTGNPVGTPLLMPGSATSYGGTLQSSVQMQRTPASGRPAGKPGVYVAYPGGYPTTTRVLLWKVGSAHSTVLASDRGGVSNVSLSVDDAGRVWVFWNASSGRLVARRSNPTVSAFGASVSRPAPSGTSAAWHLFGNAGPGALDVFGSFTTGSSTAYWHTQVHPGLSLNTWATVLKKTRRVKLTVTVTDAGVPVPAANVTIPGHHAATGGGGTVTFTLVRHRGQRLAVNASKTGYVAATGGLRLP